MTSSWLACQSRTQRERERERERSREREVERGRERGRERERENTYKHRKHTHHTPHANVARNNTELTAARECGELTHTRHGDVLHLIQLVLLLLDRLVSKLQSQQLMKQAVHNVCVCLCRRVAAPSPLFLFWPPGAHKPWR